VELDESPRECVVREVREELGIEVAPGPLLVVDYQHAREHRTESLMFVFDGGVLDERHWRRSRFLPTSSRATPSWNRPGSVR
jgi:8-oxo-dGTP diphosphatase